MNEITDEAAEQARAEGRRVGDKQRQRREDEVGVEGKNFLLFQLVRKLFFVPVSLFSGADRNQRRTEKWGGRGCSFVFAVFILDLDERLVCGPVW